MRQPAISLILWLFRSQSSHEKKLRGLRSIDIINAFTFFFILVTFFNVLVFFKFLPRFFYFIKTFVENPIKNFRKHLRTHRNELINHIAGSLLS